jgi:hypothetical protein
MSPKFAQNPLHKKLERDGVLHTKLKAIGSFKKAIGSFFSGEGAPVLATGAPALDVAELAVGCFGGAWEATTGAGSRRAVRLEALAVRRSGTRPWRSDLRCSGVAVSLRGHGGARHGRPWTRGRGRPWCS